MMSWTELEDSAKRLNNTVTDWKNAFYREQSQREEIAQELEVQTQELVCELQLRIDGEIDLLTCMQSLRKVNDENELLKQALKELIAVAELVAELFEPRKAGTETRPLVERLFFF